MLNGLFSATQFYAEIEGHPDEPHVRRAMEELGYFTSFLQLLGTFPKHAYRKSAGADRQR
jgi:prephenate dehydratase